MKRRKLLLIILPPILLAATLLLIINSRPTQSLERKPYTLFYTLQDLSNPYFIAVRNGAVDRASELGIKLEVHDAQSNESLQVEALERAIRLKPDAIICSPVAIEPCIPLRKKSQQSGIPFINPNQAIPGSDANINIDEYEFGYAGGIIAGTWVRDVLDGYAKTAVIGHEQITPLAERAQGIEDGIRAIAPRVDIVAYGSANTPQSGFEEAQRIMKAHPDIEVIAAINDGAALGALAVLQGMVKDPSRYCVVGLDATSEAISKMKEPRSMFRGTVDIDPYGTGRQIIDVTVKVLEEGPIDEVIEIPMIPVTWKNIEAY